MNDSAAGDLPPDPDDALRARVETLAASVASIAVLLAELRQQSERPLPLPAPPPMGIPIYSPSPYASIPPADFADVKSETKIQTQSLRRIRSRQVIDQRDAKRWREQQTKIEEERHRRADRTVFWLKVVAVTAGPIGGIVSAILEHVFHNP